MDCKKLKHRIGEGSSYDGDMDLIESFVKYANNPEDKMIRAEISAYYMSRALHYWQQLKEFLHEANEKEEDFLYEANEKEEENLNAYVNNSEKILENFEYYEKIFFDMLNDLNNDFNLIKCTKLFIYIGKLNCYNLDVTLDKFYQNFLDYNIDLNRIFPLVNDNGVFSFNTWLYAFFEGIELVGFTSKRAEFDGEKGCSLDMFFHDLNHIDDIERKFLKDKDTELFNQYKSIYYNILNSENFSKEQKELYILMLWIIIHEEVEVGIKLKSQVEFSLSRLISWAYSNPVGIALTPEFYKFSHLLLNPENIKNTIYYFEKYWHKIGITNTINSKFRSDFIYDNDFLNSLKNIENLNAYNYLFLGAIYIFKDIKDNYDYYTKPINFIC